MKIVYSLHAEEKLGLAEIKKLKINKRQIEETARHPEVVDNSEKPVLIAVGKLSDKLSLCVAYRRTREGVRVITFWPAERGRYERKVLQRG